MIMKKRTIYLTLSFLTFLLALSVSDSLCQRAVNLKWNSYYGEPDSIGWSASVVDGSGNTLFTGNTQVANQGTNILTAKYDRDGVLIWQHTFNHAYSGNDYGIAITYDPAGNVYVAGTSETSAQNGFDFALLKINSAGTLLWAQHYNGSASAEDIASAIALDSDTNIIITGAGNESTSGRDYVTLKYKPNGDLTWTAYYDYHDLDDIPVDIEIYDNNDIFVTGASSDNIVKWDIATVKYNSSGQQLLTRREQGSQLGIDYPTGLCKDDSSNFIITGVVTDTTGHYNIRTLKLDSDLNLEWSTDWDGHNLDDESKDICTDNAGNIIVTGQSINSNGKKEWVTLKYTSAGSLDWEKIIHSPEQEDAIGEAVCTDQYNNIILTGSVYQYGDINVYTTVIEPDNSVIWSRCYKPGTSGTETPTKVLYIGQNKINVIGKTDWNPRDYFIMQYTYINIDKEAYTDTSNIKRYVKDNIIVRFHPDSLEMEPINNRDIQYLNIDKFLSQARLDLIEDKLPSGISTDNILLKKVFNHAHPSDTTMVTLRGDTIEKPIEWNTFLMILDCDDKEDEVIDSIQTLFPLVLSAEHNSIFYPLTNTEFLYKPANDTEYEPEQAFLHGDSWYFPEHEVIGWDCIITNDFMYAALLDDMIYLDNNAFTNEVLIGAFFQDGESKKCGGYITYNNTMISLSAWGDDPLTSEKEGFVYLEEIQWFGFAPSQNTIYKLTPIFDQYSPFSDNKYHPGAGMSIERFDMETQYHINIEAAWEYSKGDPSVIVGIMDSGVNLGHEDIPDYVNSDHLTGYDYNLNAPYGNDPYGNWDWEPDGHGTYMTGLIGAVRNNNAVGGVAGIAGEDFSDSNVGVKIFHAGVFDPNTGYPDLETMATALDDLSTTSTKYNPVTGYGQNCNIINFSIAIEYYGVFNENHKVIQQSVRKLAKQHVIFVTGRGNWKQSDPGTITDYKMVSTSVPDGAAIVFGASNNYGERWYTSMYDPLLTYLLFPKLDLVAPGSSYMVYSIDGTTTDDYKEASGTSCSSAIGAGVIALAYKPYKTNNSNIPPTTKNMEKLLERTATDLLTTGRDRETGYGLLNAGKALYKCSLNKFKFFDFSFTKPPSLTPIYNYEQTLDIAIYEDIIGYGDQSNAPIPIVPGVHTMEVYKFTVSNTHALETDYEIENNNCMDANVNNSYCNLYGPPEPNGNGYRLTIGEDVRFASWPSNTYAELEGYCYKITNTSNSFIGGSYSPTEDVWIPINPNETNVDFHYTIHATHSDYIINIPELIVDNNISLYLYPNPAINTLHVEILDNGKISGKIGLYDLQGRIVNKWNIYGFEKVTRSFNISRLRKGMYYLTFINQENKYKSIKFVKGE